MPVKIHLTTGKAQPTALKYKFDRVGQSGKVCSFFFRTATFAKNLSFRVKICTHLRVLNFPSQLREKSLVKLVTIVKLRVTPVNPALKVLT